MPKFILFNGPPRSGKDTAAALTIKWLNHLGRDNTHEKFSAPLKEAFAGMMNVSIDNFVVEHYEERKDEIIPCLGVSFRQWQIDFSEKFMKPLYGQDVFGRLLINRLDQNMFDPIVIISDCGFQVEVDVLLKTYNPDDIILFCIDKAGTSYAGDSRGRVSAPRQITITNNRTLGSLKNQLEYILKEWIA